MLGVRRRPRCDRLSRENEGSWTSSEGCCARPCWVVGKLGAGGCGCCSKARCAVERSWVRRRSSIRAISSAIWFGQRSVMAVVARRARAIAASPSTEGRPWGALLSWSVIAAQAETCSSTYVACAVVAAAWAAASGLGGDEKACRAWHVWVELHGLVLRLAFTRVSRPVDVGR